MALDRAVRKPQPRRHCRHYLRSDRDDHRRCPACEGDSPRLYGLRVAEEVTIEVAFVLERASATPSAGATAGPVVATGTPEAPAGNGTPVALGSPTRSLVRSDGRLAIAARVGDNVATYLVNADGSGLTRLTNAAGQESAPTWSPDGTRIAFTRQGAPCGPEVTVQTCGEHGPPRTKSGAPDRQGVTDARSPVATIAGLGRSPPHGRNPGGLQASPAPSNLNSYVGR